MTRLRDLVLLPSSVPGGLLVYDLERTFVFDVPDDRIDAVRAAVAETRSDPWLVANDLYTNQPPPSRPDPFEARLPTVSDVSLDLAGACNLGCAYCFEEPIASRGAPASPQTLDDAVDFAFRGGSPALTFHFGSGEPLLRFKSLQRVVERAEGLAAQMGTRVGFEITTNATLVTPEIARWLAAHPFRVRVSLDGPPEIHDSNRPTVAGAASYAAAERGLALLVQQLEGEVIVNSVRTGTTRLQTLWRWARALGVRHLQVIKVGSRDDDALGLATAELETYRADLSEVADDILADLAADRVPTEFQPFTKIIRRLMLPQPITRFCGAGGTYLGVSTSGAVYPCFRHLGLEPYALGDVRDGVSEEARRHYVHTIAEPVDRRVGCDRCWARYLCGGGCYADSVVYGDERKPIDTHCPFWRAEISAAIALYRRIVAERPTDLLRLYGNDPDAVIAAALDGRDILPAPGCA